MLLVKADAHEENKQAYLAYAVRNLIMIQTSGKSRFPTYSQYVSEMSAPRKADTRTADDIKNHILSKLGVK